MEANVAEGAQPADFDSPWKEALEQFLPDAVALFAPTVHATIDWTRGYVPLDKELQQIAPVSAQGRRVADLLVQVWSRSGEEEWLLLHIEVQGQRVAEFAKRMFTYHYRLLDRFDRDVMSIALLTDGSRRWRPGAYERANAASRLRFDYTVVKLLDWREREAELAANANPFAVVVQAHLLALATQRRRSERLQPKLALVRALYDRGFDRERIQRLFRFIDWVVQLPEADAPLFWEQLRAEMDRMPYVTQTERLLIGRGRVEGRVEVLTMLLRARFGPDAEPVVEALERPEVALDMERLTALLASNAPLKNIKDLIVSP